LKEFFCPPFFCWNQIKQKNGGQKNGRQKNGGLLDA
jgi:hypothetical protein